MKDYSDSKENKKNTSEEVEDTAKPAKKQEQDLVNFDSWFTIKCSEKRKVEVGHYDTLRTFFKKQGLNENEAASDFDAALKIFGF